MDTFIDKTFETSVYQIYGGFFSGERKKNVALGQGNSAPATP
jgi:hypothetical protein